MTLNDGDYAFMEKAIELSRNCKSEDAKVSPNVGVVVVKDNAILAETYRGMINEGEHAEYIALEKNLFDLDISGSTVYTTLEPCTLRNHPKKPCADRLIERKVNRVVIGMLDPNPSICGKGFRRLRQEGINVVMFPNHLMDEVEKINLQFTHEIEKNAKQSRISEDFVVTYKKRKIDGWYNAINYIFSEKNFYRDTTSIFTHLVEQVGALSPYSNFGGKQIDSTFSVSKPLAWWFALCGKVGIKNIGDMLWAKFPGVCPYCKLSPHSLILCQEMKATSKAPDWAALKKIGEEGKINNLCPTSLGQWQSMFKSIYLHDNIEAKFDLPFARLFEELAELAEAIRVFHARPGYFVSEASDVFAWLMNIQNNIDIKNGIDAELFGSNLEENFCRTYPDFCTACKKQRCVCPAVPPETIGRLGYEMPMDRTLFDFEAIFVSQDKASEIFIPPT